MYPVSLTQSTVSICTFCKSGFVNLLHNLSDGKKIAVKVVELE